MARSNTGNRFGIVTADENEFLDNAKNEVLRICREYKKKGRIDRLTKMILDTKSKIMEISTILQRIEELENVIMKKLNISELNYSKMDIKINKAGMLEINGISIDQKSITGLVTPLHDKSIIYEPALENYQKLLEFIYEEIDGREIKIKLLDSKYDTSEHNLTPKIPSSDIRADGFIQYKIIDDKFILHTQRGWQSLINTLFIIYNENISTFRSLEVRFYDLISDNFGYIDKNNKVKTKLSKSELSVFWSRITPEKFDNKYYYEEVQQTIVKYLKENNIYKINKLIILKAQDIAKYHNNDFINKIKPPNPNLM